MIKRRVSLKLSLTKIVKIYSILLSLVILYLYHYMWLAKFNFHAEPDARIVLFGDPQMEGTHRIRTQGWYGWFAVNMNDYYFKHIVNNVMYYVQPTHIFVLGDIFSFQNLPEEEFNLRVSRYNWIFSHPDILSQNVLLYNISGNHDIGYATEVSRHLITKFEKVFGPVNSRYYAAGHILGVVNSMNLDKPRYKELAERSWNQLKELSEERSTSDLPLILFTHIPLYKPKGNCMDDPLIWLDNDGYVKEQWMLSEDVSNFIVNDVKPKFIFTGHDHYGCTYKHNNYTTEFTVRSVMGDFGGYTAVLEITSHKDEGGKVYYDYNHYNTSFIVMYGVTALIVAIGIWIALLVLWLLVRVFYRLRELYRKRKKIE